MLRRRPPLTRFLALLLVVQWAVAFGQCFAPSSAAASGGDRIEICTADGLHTIVLGGDGTPAPEPAAAHRPTCPECCGPAALDPAPPGLAAVPVVWTFAAPMRQREGLPVAPARPPPQQPRAPPTA